MQVNGKFCYSEIHFSSYILHLIHVAKQFVKFYKDIYFLKLFYFNFLIYMYSLLFLFELALEYPVVLIYENQLL